ncbi:imidazole glycerol phosphate synthase cyclase subunit [Candidatus Pelagibacter sp.]|nr:imidazole glycerol phosphate synthase cyclase subunit [Candidatus Pelagibacter sp.]
MTSKVYRIIPRLEIKNGNLIKGINLEGLRILGNPEKFTTNYLNQGADEIIYHDSIATLYGTNNLSKPVKNISNKLFIPLTVGGGIRKVNDIEKMLKNGADKISINSEAINNIKFINQAAKIFGSSTIVSNIECIKIKNKYYISKSNGRDLININPVDWAKKLEDNGVGEIIITSVNNEGIQKGFDINLTKKISNIVKVPVIAHGGAGKFEDVLEVIKKTKITGVSISSLFHYDTYMLFKFDKKKIGNLNFLKNSIKKKSNNNLKKLKKFLSKKGINVR